mgnify:CR=1 FL=1
MKVMKLKRIYENLLTEAGLARMLSRMTSKYWCVMSAERISNSPLENEEATRALVDTLNKRRMGGYPLIGHWQEAPDGIDYQDAEPDTLTDTTENAMMFIKPDDASPEKFIQFCISLSVKYNQDAVIIGVPENGMDEIFLYYPSGKRDLIGNQVTLDKIGQGYSQLKAKPNVPFVFEGLK